MRFGITMFPTDEAITPQELAAACEQRGFESLWLPEHTHIPASRLSPWPGGPNLPREYTRTYDPFVGLAMAAAATTTLKLATGVCLVVERDPIITAKEVASLDRLSNGRLLFGVGAGWNLEEMANHGTDPGRRFRLLRERIEAMKAIWSQDEASYRGELVAFDGIWSWPKPLQQPHPPIIVGGDSEGTFDRVVRWADEWMPIFGRNPEPLAHRIPRLQEKADAAGRGPIPVGVFVAPPDAGKLDELRRAGVTRAVFGVPAASADVVLPILDNHAKLAASLS